MCWRLQLRNYNTHFCKQSLGRPQHTMMNEHWCWRVFPFLAWQSGSLQRPELNLAQRYCSSGVQYIAPLWNPGRKRININSYDRYQRWNKSFFGMNPNIQNSGLKIRIRIWIFVTTLAAALKASLLYLFPCDHPWRRRRSVLGGCRHLGYWWSQAIVSQGVLPLKEWWFLLEC